MTKREKVIDILNSYSRGGADYVADKILELDEVLSEGEIYEIIDEKIPSSAFDQNILPDQCSTRLKKALAKALSGRIAKPQEPIKDSRIPLTTNQIMDLYNQKITPHEVLPQEPVCSCKKVFYNAVDMKDCPIHGEKEKPRKLVYQEVPNKYAELEDNIRICMDSINKINERKKPSYKLSKVKLPYSSNFDNLLVLEGKVNDIIDYINNL